MDKGQYTDQHAHPMRASTPSVRADTPPPEVGAVAADRRAADSGDADAAFNLGLLLEERGDPDGAAAAYRRAAAAGDAGAALNLGLLLRRRGDPDGAVAAIRQAAAAGDPKVAAKAERLLRKWGL